MRTSLTTVVIIFGLASAGIVAAQQDEFRVRVDVALVTLSVEVTDANNRPVTNLTRDDFQIYEDGVRQDLRSFDSVETPYSILLLFDCSSSTEPDWPFLLQAMNRFTERLRPQDRIAVAQFGGGFKVIQKWFAKSEASIDVAIQTRDLVCSGTDFYGAVKRSIEELQAVKGRKGVVILSDGGHQQIPFQRTRSENSGGLAGRFVNAVDDSDFQKTVRIAAASPAVLYFVAVDTDLNPDRGRADATTNVGIFDPNEIYNKQQIRSRIELLASASGGRVVYPEKPEDVVRLYERMAQELGSSYSLGYAPAAQKDGSYHKIEVRLRDRSLHLQQSRDGYVAR